MATYQVGIHQTEELENHLISEYGDADRVLNILETYVDNALSRAGHTLDPVIPGGSIQAPHQDPQRSVSTTCPCLGIGTCDYGTLTYWYYDYVTCQNIDYGKDSNLLITNYDSTNYGWAISEPWASAAGGQYIAKLDMNYKTHAYKNKYGAMETALHEIGHNLIENYTDGDGEEGDDHNEEHDVGETYTRIDGNTITPMGMLGSTNDCKDRNDGSTGWEMTWSSCAVNNYFVNPN
jgi:hypothetical protein